MCQSLSPKQGKDADLGKAMYKNRKILILIYAMSYLCNLLLVKFGHLGTKSSICQGGNVSAKAAAEELPDQNSSLSRKPRTYTAYRFLLAVRVLVG